MGNCYDCFSPQPEVETPDPVSEKTRYSAKICSLAYSKFIVITFTIIMWAFEQIYTGNKYFSLSAIFLYVFLGPWKTSLLRI